MTLDSVVSAGRTAAEARMLDSVTITAPGTGTSTLDPTTGQYPDPTPSVVYSGKARLAAPSQAGVSVAAAGQASWDVENTILHLPVDGTDTVAPGHTVTVDSAGFDPALVDNVYGVIGVLDGSQATARRVLVKRVVH